MKKTFSNPKDKVEILERLNRLRSDSPRKWGRMTAHQAICHLEDAFKCRTGEKGGETKDNWFSRSVMKWVALNSPMPWPHGIKTMPAFDQEIDGTPPEDFERDRAKLAAAIERFSQPPTTESKPHPIFGLMAEADWLRWGYLHCDHHLRQFGV